MKILSNNQRSKVRVRRRLDKNRLIGMNRGFKQKGKARITHSAVLVAKTIRKVCKKAFELDQVIDINKYFLFITYLYMVVYNLF